MKTTLSAVVSDAFAEVESLREELQDWLDSMPENLQASDKAQQLEEAIQALEYYEEPELPEQLDGALEVSYTSDRGRGRYPSRATRCANACAMIDAALDAMDDKFTYVGEVDEFKDALQEAHDNWEGVEFPGMFG